jgi:hypothetical protein
MIRGFANDKGLFLVWDLLIAALEKLICSLLISLTTAPPIKFNLPYVRFAELQVSINWKI